MGVDGTHSAAVNNEWSSMKNFYVHISACSSCANIYSAELYVLSAVSVRYYMLVPATVDQILSFHGVASTYISSHYIIPY